MQCFLNKLRNFNISLMKFGINFRTLFINIKCLPLFLIQLRHFKKDLGLIKDNNFSFKINMAFADSKSEAGVGRGIYFNMDLYVAQQIHDRNPLNILISDQELMG